MNSVLVQQKNQRCCQDTDAPVAGCAATETAAAPAAGCAGGQPRWRCLAETAGAESSAESAAAVRLCAAAAADRGKTCGCCCCC